MKTRRQFNLGIIFIFVISSFSLFAQTQKDLSNAPIAIGQQVTDVISKIPSDPSVRAGKLANGIHYFIQKNIKPENRAELRLVVNAGSMQEDDDQQGMAHFVEHMAFNGSTNFSKNELVDYLESVGTRFGPDLNAYTSFDETVYMLQVRTDDADHLDKGLTVIEDWAHGVSFDDEEIDKERGVVISEWRSRLSADQRMQQKYFPVMYYNSRYAVRLPIGKPELIENAPYDAFKRFYRDWYRPDLMAVVVVGDIDIDQIEQEIKNRFEKIASAKNPRQKVDNSIPNHKETFISIEKDKEAAFTQVRMIIKHPHKPVSNLLEYRKSLVRNLYNRMLNARMDELTRLAEPPYMYGYSGYGRDVGNIDTYSSFAFVPEGKALSGFEAILKENYRALRHGFHASELERQKVEILVQLEKNVKEKEKTESSRIASRLVYHFLKSNPIPSPEQQLELYQQFLETITIEEVNNLSKTFLKDENMVIVVTGPDKEGVELPIKEELLNSMSEIKKMDLAPYEDSTVDEPLMTKKLVPAEIVSEEMMTDLGIEVWKLSNGIEVMSKQTDFKNDEINMSAYSFGGHSIYDMDKYFSARAAASIVRQSGLRIFDMNQMERLLSGKNVRVSPFISERYEGIRGNCSPDDFQTLFELIYLTFTEPRKDTIAFQSYLVNEKGFLKNIMSNPNYWFSDQVTKITTQNHPRRGFPSTEDLELVSMDDAFRIYQDRFADASDFTFFFVGNFDKKELKEYCKLYLGNLPAIDRNETWQDVGVYFPEGKIEKTLYRGEAPKSNVNIIYHGDYEWDEWNNYVFQSMISLMRIKLREALREDKGGVYGVGISGSPRKEPNQEYRISINFNSDPPRTNELIETAYGEIQKIKDGTVDEKDLQKVKETQRQSRIKDLKQNRFWQSQMQQSFLNGTDLNNLKLEKLESWIENLSAEDLKKAVEKFFNSEEMIQIVMHPEMTEE